jgi:beta-glucosidase
VRVAITLSKGINKVNLLRKKSSRKLCALVAASCLLAANVAPARAQTQSALGAPSASGVDARVESILKQLTLEEKLDLLGGVDDFFVRGVPRLKLPRLRMADGPLGVRNFGPATAMAGGVSLAATWNPALAERVGTEIGRDARAKGVHFLLGPGVNIYRAPLNGRNFEYFGEDPWLASRIAVGYIRGVQSQGVSATIKHFMGNNSEFDRHNSDSIIDERTMREIYLPTFEAAVREAHVGAIMDSYNLINGEHASQNQHLLTDIAKRDWGFDGLIMSDWGATYDGVGATNGGQDLEMPWPAHQNRETLLPAIRSGKVSEATIDDHVRRILHTAARFGWLDRDQLDPSIPRFNQQGRQAALEAAREGMVLLKNDGGLLPFNKSQIKTVAVIGPDAYPAVPVGGGSAGVQPFAAVSFMQGLGNYLGASARVLYSPGIPSIADMAEATDFSTEATGGQRGLSAEYFKGDDLSGPPVVTRTDQHVNFSAQSRRNLPTETLSARWTGYFTPKSAGAQEVFVQSTGEDGGFFRLYVDDRPVLDDWSVSRALTDSAVLTLGARPHKFVLEQHGRSGWLGTKIRLGVIPPGGIVDEAAKRLAAQADAVVLAVGFDPTTESEGADRTFRLPPGQDELIRQIAAANKRTVVVVTSGGGVDTSAWLDQIPGLIQAWYPGQEGGTALAEILYGDVNPSGRLPMTFERRWEDNPVHDSYYPASGTRRVEYREGVFVGYRGYEHNSTRPLFPFGYGLSYTTFVYSNLTVRPVASRGNDGALYEVSFDVRNTGTRPGSEVAQVYVGPPAGSLPRPAKELKGFSKVTLRPGERQRVTVTLNGRSFSYYDAGARQWRAQAGDYQVLVGRSSEQIELRSKLNLTATQTAAIR